ncbi:MAG: Maf family protein [Bacteroidota bacterium]
MRFACPFILASGSPRRRQLLERLGVTFEVEVSHVDETTDAEQPPADLVEHLALRKATAVAQGHPEALTLGADTVVVLDDEVLGKPATPQEARTMLHRLSGQTHTVYTGLGLVHPASARRVSVHEATEVTFAALTSHEIDHYVASGAPMDKAGSYGIQDDRGALFVVGIAGDYYNVVGLPLHRLYRTLQTDFADVLVG